jgi:hypothetical protein
MDISITDILGAVVIFVNRDLRKNEKIFAYGWTAGLSVIRPREFDLTSSESIRYTSRNRKWIAVQPYTTIAKINHREPIPAHRWFKRFPRQIVSSETQNPSICPV